MKAVQPGKSQISAVNQTSAKFSNPMEPAHAYHFSTDTDCWVHVGATGDSAESATAGNVFVGAGDSVVIANEDNTGTDNGYVHVIRDSAATRAWLR